MCLNLVRRLVGYCWVDALVGPIGRQAARYWGDTEKKTTSRLILSDGED